VGECVCVCVCERERERQRERECVCERERDLFELCLIERLELVLLLPQRPHLPSQSRRRLHNVYGAGFKSDMCTNCLNLYRVVKSLLPWRVLDTPSQGQDLPHKQ